ncbi:MAG: carboxymuconolactone decarboxylase family protein [Hyphomonadaceae bacterium]
MSDKLGSTPDKQRKIEELHEKRQAIFGPVDMSVTSFPDWVALDEDLAIKVSEFFVGGLYQREVLSQRERELCAVAALTAIRAEDELRAHIRAALNCGATPKEIGEVIFQMITYAGMPAFVSAVRQARTVFEAQGVWPRK